MKKVSAVSLLLCIMLCFGSFAGCAKKNSDVPDGMKLISSDDADYYMYVPDVEGMWRVDRSDKYTSAYYSSGDQTSISTTAFNITKSGVTVESWWEEFRPEIEKTFSDVGEIIEADARIDGVNGKEYKFSGKIGDDEYKYIITAVVKDSYVYFITYTSIPKYYENHLEDLEKVIDTFTFK